MASISTCFTLSPKLRLSTHSNFSSSPLLSPRFPNYFPAIQSPCFRRSLSRSGNSRVLLPVVRAAGIDLAAGIKPGGAIESDKLPTDVRNRVTDAIDAAGGRVTIGDVASRAGLNLNEAQKALQALAADTGGFLEVSDEGDVLYVFPKGYRSNLAAKSFKIKLEPVIEKGKAAAEYVMRVSFGTALIASIVIVYTAIIALVTSSRSEDDNRGRRGRSYNPGFNFFFSPTDLFWYWDPNYYRRRRIQRDNEGMNFIESVFSFVFGDGDPNQGIEEERWKLIGKYITSNGGVVTAEELAPYLDLETTDRSDESYILPVLLRFEGQPEIDEEGNILYRFPSLQRTASSKGIGRKEYVGRKWADLVGEAENFFKEKRWQFSKTSGSERALVIGLGALNLTGVIILGAMLMRGVTSRPSDFISFVAEIYPLLQIYAASFFAIPLVRWFLVNRKNAAIEKRNHAREQFAKALGSPDLSLRRKLLSARDMAQKTVIGQDRIVYSTEKDLLDQDYEAREWDKRFREIE